MDGKRWITKNGHKILINNYLSYHPMKATTITNDYMNSKIKKTYTSTNNENEKLTKEEQEQIDETIERIDKKETFYELDQQIKLQKHKIEKNEAGLKKDYKFDNEWMHDYQKKEIYKSNIIIDACEKKKDFILKNESEIDKITRIIGEDIKKAEIENNYYEKFSDMQDYMNAVGYGDSKDVKEDVMYILDKNGFNVYDDGDVELKDGSLISYRKYMTNVRKKWFKYDDDTED